MGIAWKIEEVHRQIKSDYKEHECVVMGSGFVPLHRLENLCLDLICHPELALVNRKRGSDLLRFMFNKLALE